MRLFDEEDIEKYSEESERVEKLGEPPEGFSWGVTDDEHGCYAPVLVLIKDGKKVK